MSSVSAAIAIGVVSAGAVLPMSAEAQRRPDFSGHWILVDGQVSGAARDSSKPAADQRPTITTTISGSPFNCGRECTITQKGQTLTIADARLADYPGRDKSQPTPAVTIDVDGRTTRVVDSFSPSRQLPVSARWDGDRLRIESQPPESAVARIQVLSLKPGVMVVVSSTTINGEAHDQTTFTYRRK